MSVAAQPGSLVPAVTVGIGNSPGNSIADRPITTGVGPFGGRPSTTSPTRCTHVDLDYDPIIAVICSVYVFIGLMYAFFGYRMFKCVMFLTGLTFGSALVYCICQQEALLGAMGNVACALLAGLLFGTITALVQYVGLFVTGLHTGLLLGAVGLAAADHAIDRTVNRPRHADVWLCVAVLLAAAILFAIINLYWRKAFTILGTSIYGGAVFAAASDYFVEKFAALPWLWERVSLGPLQPPPCWYTWIVLGSWPVVAAIGLLTQATVTGTGRHHAHTIGGRKKPRAAVQRPRTREERAELRQKKYRYLYQVRTAHGDVISQNYVQALQRRDCDMTAGECSTLQSDATHLTILPDAQLQTLSESDDDSHNGHLSMVNHHR